MTLDELLSIRRPVPRPAFPDLMPLASAKKRVMDRWPDVVAKPPERDHERLLTQFKSTLENDAWHDVKLTFVLRVGHVAFDTKFRGRADLQPVLDFFMEELAATQHATFVNGMMSIYLSSFEPGAGHSLRFAERLVKKQDVLNARWKKVLEALPALFDAGRAHNVIANALLAKDAPYEYLEGLGFPNPLSGGLIDHAHIQYVSALKPQLHTRAVIEKLFHWIRPKPGMVRTSGSTAVIEAVLSPWTSAQPSDEIQQLILDNLIAAYNDPRTNRGQWAGVSEESMNVVFRWLTREDMRFFTGVVDATQNNHMWPPRRDFWLQLYDEKRIDQAWVAFCPSAERYARSHLIKSGAGSQRRFGRQTSRPDTSLLIMKIGNKIVVDGCHSYKTHIFDEKDTAAPRLFEWDYDCNNIMRRSLTSKSHSSIPAWKEWVRETLNAKVEVTPVQTYRPAAARPTPAPPRSSAPPVQPRLTNIAPSNLRMEAMKDLNRLAYQLEQLELLGPELRSAVARLESRQVLGAEELTLMRSVVATYGERYSLQKLELFLAPIFAKELSPQDMALWIRKAKLIADFASLRGLLSPKSREALERMAENQAELSQSERNAIEHLAQQFRAQGVELSDFIRKED